MQTTRICLVRHGETAWNAEQRLQGHADIPLNPRGHSQAQATARALADTPLAAIYHSDLQRAALTAQTIAAAHPGTHIEPLPALRERHFGAFQGRTRAESEQHAPQAYARMRAREADAPLPGGGESLRSFARRIENALLDIARRHAGETVLIVSHGGCMDIIYRLVTQRPLHTQRDFALGNATLNWIEYAHGQWQLLDWDDARHLAGSRDEIAV